MRFVLLHGFTGSPASWDTVVQALPGAAQVLRPALLGHAPDAGDAADWDAEIDRLAAIVTGAGFTGAHLAGYSLGGRVALGLLARHAHLFTSATAISARLALRSADERAARAAADEQWAAMLEPEGAAAFAAAWAAQPLFATQSMIPAGARARQQQIRAAHDPRGLARAMRTLGLARMPDLRIDTARPITCMAGELDEKFATLAVELAATLPRARAHIVPGAGHDLLLERPDAVAAELRLNQESPS